MLNSVFNFFKRVDWTLGKRQAQETALRDYYRIEYSNDNDHASPTDQVRVQDRLGNIWYKDKLK